MSLAPSSSRPYEGLYRDFLAEGLKTDGVLVSENRGPQYSTLNSEIPIIRTPT